MVVREIGLLPAQVERIVPYQSKINNNLSYHRLYATSMVVLDF